MAEKDMNVTKGRYGANPLPSSASSVVKTRNATSPDIAMSTDRPRTERDIVTIGRDCLCWSVTYLNSLFGICVAFVIGILDPYISDSWRIPDGLFFGFVMALNVVLVGGWVFRDAIGAMRIESGR